MTGLTRYMIGATARCADGACGQVSRVVMDPAAMTVTHLVIEPEDPPELGRLVPLDLLDTRPGEISLRCTTAEFCQLPRAEKTQFVRGTGDFARYGQDQPVRPYLAQAGSRPGAGVDGRLPQTFTYDVLPAGEVVVRGGDPVHAIDGEAGHVTGVVVDAGTRQVAYLLVHARHLLGKNIAVPVSAVTRVDAGIQLDIARDDVMHLPAVELGQAGG
ncbi:MAG: PRC-barrel domain-containing protein [Streptosporangiaceae bacterium]